MIVLSHALTWFEPGQAAVLGRFTAPEDMILREVRITANDLVLGTDYYQVVSLDPELSVEELPNTMRDFQLIALSDPSKSGQPVLTVFNNLNFPLLKGQTIYWGGSVSDTFQLFFS